MLVLTRRPDQTLRIGDDIEVTVVAVRGERVRLGITAPREVEIYTAEIHERLRREHEGRPIDRITEQAKSDPLAAMVAAKKLLEARAALHEICVGRSHERRSSSSRTSARKSTRRARCTNATTTSTTR